MDKNTVLVDDQELIQLKNITEEMGKIVETEEFKKGDCKKFEDLIDQLCFPEDKDNVDKNPYSFNLKMCIVMIQYYYVSKANSKPEEGWTSLKSRAKDMLMKYLNIQNN